MICRITDFDTISKQDWNKVIFYAVKEFGYNKSTFRNEFNHMFVELEEIPNKYDNEYNDFTEWISNVNSNQTFLYQARTAFFRSYVNEADLLIIASAIDTFLKENVANRKNNDQELTLEEFKCAVYKTVKTYGYDKIEYLNQLSEIINQDNSDVLNVIPDIDDWCMTEEYQFDDDFKRTALMTWNIGNFKTSYQKKMFGIAVKTYLYFSKSGKNRERKTSEEEFKIGDRITINVREFKVLKSYAEIRNFHSLQRYVYELKDNGYLFRYDGTIEPDEMESTNKISGVVKKITTENGQKIVEIGTVRRVK